MQKLTKRQANFIMTEVSGIILSLAVAFMFVAMPQNVFEGLVSASGLPLILSAAQPPLGETARMVVAALAGSLAGMVVIALFLLLDREPEKKDESVRPFSASNDLFSFEAPSFAKSQVAEEPVAQDEAVSVPFVVLDAPDELADFDTKAIEEPIFLDFRAIRAANQPVEESTPLDLTQWKVVEPAPPVKPEVKVEVNAKAEAEVAVEPKPRPITSPDRRAEDESISSLMARLDAGLDRRTDPAQPPAINRSGVGLRSTLDELRKMAVKH